MALAFALMVMVDGVLIVDKGDEPLFASIKICNDYAKQIAQPFKNRNRNQQVKITAWCEPRKISSDTPLIWK